MPTDHSAMRLGKGGARFDARTPLLAHHVAATAPLPPPPATLGWSGISAAWGVLANDRLGDCTIAAALHLTQLWTVMAGVEVVPDEAAAVSLYQQWAGYDPANPVTDAGAVELDILGKWMAGGLAMNDTDVLRQIHGFASVTFGNLDEVRAAAYTFGGLYVGAQMPVAAQTQPLWDAPSGTPAGDDAPGSWGGHAMALIDFNPIGPVFMTWGLIKQATWRWWLAYIDEAYVVLSRDLEQAGMIAATGARATWDSMVAHAQEMGGTLLRA